MNIFLCIAFVFLACLVASGAHWVVWNLAGLFVFLIALSSDITIGEFSIICIIGFFIFLALGSLVSLFVD